MVIKGIIGGAVALLVVVIAVGLIQWYNGYPGLLLRRLQRQPREPTDPPRENGEWKLYDTNCSSKRSSIVFPTPDKETNPSPYMV